MITPPDQELAKKHHVTAMVIMTNTDTQKLNRLAELVDAGKVKPQVDKVFTFSQTMDAFKYLSESHPRGKVVIKIKE